MIKAKLQSAVKEAMKAKNKVRLDAIRGALSAMQYEAMEKKVDELGDDQCLSVLQREIKKRKEEADFALQAKREDLITNLKVEISTLEEFLPAQLSAADLEKTLLDLKANTPGLNMGAAMKLLREKLPGQFDGKVASEVAKRVFG